MQIANEPVSKCFIISSNHRVGSCRVRLEFLVTPEQFDNAYVIQLDCDETRYLTFDSLISIKKMVNLMTRPLSVPIKPYTKNSDQSSHLPIQLYIQTILTQKKHNAIENKLPKMRPISPNLTCKNKRTLLFLKYSVRNEFKENSLLKSIHCRPDFTNKSSVPLLSNPCET
jgi:hypothetical protein